MNEATEPASVSLPANTAPSDLTRPDNPHVNLGPDHQPTKEDLMVTGAEILRQTDVLIMMRKQDFPELEEDVEVEALSGKELIQAFDLEYREQGAALRGPIPLWEIQQPGKPVPGVWYKRLTRLQAEEIDQLFREKQDLGEVFRRRALGPTGERLFEDGDRLQMELTNPFMIQRVVDLMMRGSRTKLTDADLGKY